MERKVGLIPLVYDEYNYGGVLQFYALQATIVRLGYSGEIIRCEIGGSVCPHKINNGNIIKRAILKPAFVLRNKIIEKNTRVRKKKIATFRVSRYFPVIERNHINPQDYQAIICGSDQIWNPNWVTRRTMLADFPDNVNKIIYAASMGVETMTAEQKSAFKPLVQRIQHVSVREYSAKKLLETFVDRNDIQVVLDPTMLLSPNEWEDIAVFPKEENYLIAYILGNASQYKDTIQEFAKQNRLKIVTIPFASGDKLDRCVFGDIKKASLSPEEFLGMIKNARYVFTDSFHACVFSVLFQVPFYVFERKDSSNMIGRIKTLLKNFHIENRIIPADSHNLSAEQIDYTKNDMYQARLVKPSIEFLEESIINAK